MGLDGTQLTRTHRCDRGPGGSGRHRSHRRHRRKRRNWPNWGNWSQRCHRSYRSHRKYRPCRRRRSHWTHGRYGSNRGHRCMDWMTTDRPAMITGVSQLQRPQILISPLHGQRPPVTAFFRRTGGLCLSCYRGVEAENTHMAPPYPRCSGAVWRPLHTSSSRDTHCLPRASGERPSVITAPALMSISPFTL